jgi:LPXTG-motif cell wall-anchored protein
MNIKLNAAFVGGLLALTSFLVQAKADEWDKRTEFQFSVPVEIPGQVLPAGKYVFQLADSESDRNVVQVFSEDSAGKQSLVATVMAVPDYMTETPDKPIVHFEERTSGSPEAVHNWFYPGENTGWQFVYPKGQTQQPNTNQVANTPTTPAPAPVAAAPAPSPAPAPPALQAAEPAWAEAVVEDEAVIVQNDVPAAPPTEEIDVRSTADTLPQTGGYSDLQLSIGLLMFSGGVASVFASRRKSLA